MKKIELLITVILLSILLPMKAYSQNIVPEPLFVKNSLGTFNISADVQIVINNESLSKSVDFLNGYLQKYYGFELQQADQTKRGGKYIELRVEEAEKFTKGEYFMDVNPFKIEIVAFDPSGVFYGIQSLIQLFPTDPSTSFDIASITVKDKPRFEYRGMHLDVVRHIFSVDYIKKYIDYIALHKMNYFHWHLTDDQGWRMESKSHPALNEKAAYRDGTIIGIFPGTGVDSTRYGGYYTIDQMKEIIKYAADRYITIVPEIDIPGHSMAILATYPEFSTEPDKVFKPAITWGIFNRQNNVLAPRPETFKFLEDVFNELMDIFPGEYIHIGADECAHMWWEKDPVTQQFIKDNNLKDEDGLQKYFAQKVCDVVKSRGRIPVGWDEMIQNGLVEDVVVMNWRDSTYGHQALEQGHKVILSPLKVSYFNVKQIVNETRFCHRSRTVSLERVYNFEPAPDFLTEKQKSLILGGAGCMWTEYFPEVSDVEYGIFPRMSALAEVYWSASEKKDYKAFLKKVPTLKSRYRLWGANYFDVPLEK